MNILPVLAALVLLALPRLGSGLSYSVCNTIAEEFVTEGPRLDGDWPYYSLLYTCTGNLTLEGYSVDACVVNGTKCGQAAADAFCQYLGFDYNSVGVFTTEQAEAPALSMTGEWCVSPGVYKDLGHPNRTQFDAIKQANAGPYCAALSSVTCVRARSSLAAGLAGVRQRAAEAPAGPPLGSPQPSRTANVLVNPSTLSAGRRMQAFAATSR